MHCRHTEHSDLPCTNAPCEPKRRANVVLQGNRCSYSEDHTKHCPHSENSNFPWMYVPSESKLQVTAVLQEHYSCSAIRTVHCSLLEDSNHWRTIVSSESTQRATVVFQGDCCSCSLVHIMHCPPPAHGIIPCTIAL